MGEDWTQIELDESSNVEAAHYDSARAVVRVLFKGGGRYDYFGVRSSVVGDWIEAPSVGKFLNSVLKDDHRFPVVRRG